MVAVTKTGFSSKRAAFEPSQPTRAVSSGSAMTGFSIWPRPSISTRTRSPATSSFGGFIAIPTPLGVPVATGVAAMVALRAADVALNLSLGPWWIWYLMQGKAAAPAEDNEEYEHCP